MSKLIKKYQKRFTTIDNGVLNDTSLSWKAKGLFAYLWSKPDDWDFYEIEIAKHSSDGRSSLRAGIKELEGRGYLTRSRQRSTDGKLGGTDWILSENPMQKKPMYDDPMFQNRTYDNQTLLNTNNTNTDLTKDLQTNTPLPPKGGERAEPVGLPFGAPPADQKTQKATSELEDSFEELWKDYPRKAGKKQAFAHYKKWRKESKEHTAAYLAKRLGLYKAYLAANHTAARYILQGSTWFNGRFDDDYEIRIPEPKNMYDRHYE